MVTAASKLRNGQRIEVMLNRGMADAWVQGLVLDAREIMIEPDREPPGMSRLVAQSDITDWRLPAWTPRTGEESVIAALRGLTLGGDRGH